VQNGLELLIANKMTVKTNLKTPIGIAEITGDKDGVSQIKFIDENSPLNENIPRELTKVVEQLKAYFQGNLTEFDFPINPQGTDFQKRVWENLLKIPFGQTKSYLELSRMVGDVKAIRAVASANGKNPLWIIIPCHRVIGSDGSLTGYAGGVWRKKWLLEYENPSAQQTLF